MITSPQNPKVRLLRRLQTRKGRREEGLFLAEGGRLVLEGLRAGLEPALLLFDPEALEETGYGRELLERVEGAPWAWRATGEVLRSASDLKTPQALAAFPLPDPQPLPTDGLLPVAAGLQDPGNLGTLIRAAWAFGCAGCLCLGGVDPWHPRVVRGGMGAHFHLPLWRLDPERALPHLEAHFPRRYRAEARQGRPYVEADWRRPVALLLGGEGAGIPRRLAPAFPEAVQIPMVPEAESLNVGVAGAILLAWAFLQG